MKKDIVLQKDVNDELAWDPSVEAKNIGVGVKDGVVTLTGSVLTYSEKFAAEKAVRRIDGVRGIAEELSVDLLGEHMRNDSDITAAVANALDWNARIPKGSVTCLVEGGIVVLGGVVDWNYQRILASKSVRHILGIKGVNNQIVVRVKPADASQIKGKIADALKRLAMEDSLSIQVEADKGKVVLRGTVHSWTELDQVSRTAWSAPGVIEVENDLVVAYRGK